MSADAAPPPAPAAPPRADVVAGRATRALVLRRQDRRVGAAARARRLRLLLS